MYMYMYSIWEGLHGYWNYRNSILDLITVTYKYMQRVLHKTILKSALFIFCFPFAYTCITMRDNSMAFSSEISGK